MIILENVKKSFGSHLALKEISAVFEQPRIYGLCGENGAGKTTLLRIIAGLLVPDGGTVSIHGQNPIKHWRMKRNMGIVLDTDSLFPELTVEEFLWWVGRIRGLSDRISEEQSEAYLTALHMSHRSRDVIASLSHGMKRKVLLAAAQMGTPEILLLDEPTNALDADATASLEKMLVRHCDNGGLSIISSHNKDFIERVCTNVVLLHEGQLSEMRELPRHTTTCK